MGRPQFYILHGTVAVLPHILSLVRLQVLQWLQSDSVNACLQPPEGTIL
jgi:hypothetical protein